MKRVIQFPLFIILLLISYSPTFTQISSDQLKSINDLLKEPNGNKPGCVIGIIKDQELIFSKGIGLANLEKERSNEPNSSFSIASMTKQFIGACIGLLAIEGKLDLEEEIQTYLPEFPKYDKPITLKNLIHHTSGIKDYSNLMFMRGEYFEDFLPLKSAIELLKRQKSLNFDPGEKYSYSNSNYLLLAEIISRVSGMSFQEFGQKNLFEPLGMENTSFVNTNSSSDVIGYVKSNGNYLKSKNAPPTTQDQIVSTINDFYLWDKNFYSNKVGGEALQNLILTPGILNNQENIDYAFGLHIGEYKGLKTISHGGYMRGYDSYYVQFPDEEFSVVIFSNSPDFNSYNIAYKIAEVFLKNQLKPIPAREIPQQTRIDIPAKELKKYCGSYWNPKSKNVRVIYFNKGNLKYNRPDNYESTIIPVGRDEFRMIGNQGQQTSTVRFNISNPNKKEMIFKSTTGQETVMDHFPPPKYYRQELLKFTGTYYSEELDASYYLQIIENDITVSLNSKKMSQFVAMKKDIFKDNYLGLFEFIRENNQIKGFYLSTERAENVYFDKK